MTTTKAADLDIDITVGEYRLVGTHGAPVRNLRPVFYKTDHPTNAEHAITAVLWEDGDGNFGRGCSRCDGTGDISVYRGIEGGVCFECNGFGVVKTPYSAASAERAARRSLAEKVRRILKAEAERISKAAAWDSWKTENPNLFADLERFKTESGFFFDLLSRRTPLTERQSAAALRSLIELAWDEAIAVESPRPLIGEVGEKVTVSGRIVVRSVFDAYYGYSERTMVLIVVETAERALVKMTTAAKWAFATEIGQEVTVTAAVAEHTEYRGEPQTKVKRPRLAQPIG